MADQSEFPIYTPVASLDIEGYVTKEPVRYEHRLEGIYTPFHVGDQWGGLFLIAHGFTLQVRFQRNVKVTRLF